MAKVLLLNQILLLAHLLSCWFIELGLSNWFRFNCATKVAPVLLDLRNVIELAFCFNRPLYEDIADVASNYAEVGSFIQPYS